LPLARLAHGDAVLANLTALARDGVVTGRDTLDRGALGHGVLLCWWRSISIHTGRVACNPGHEKIPDRWAGDFLGLSGEVGGALGNPVVRGISGQHATNTRAVVDVLSPVEVAPDLRVADRGALALGGGGHGAYPFVWGSLSPRRYLNYTRALWGVQPLECGLCHTTSV